MGFDIDTTDPHFALAAALRDEFSRDAVERDKIGGRPTKEIAALKASGLLNLLIPKRFGGAGETWSKALRIAREFAKVDGSLAHLYGYHFLAQISPVVRSAPGQTDEILRQSAANHWFWGNTANPIPKTLNGTSEGSGFVLNGRQSFCSGSHVADRLLVGWDDVPNDRRVFALIEPARKGISILDDWDGIGQRQTGSGTVVFDNVRIDGREVLTLPDGPGKPVATLTPLFQQSALLNVFVGSAQGALETARDYTLTKSRPWLTSGVERPIDDPWVKRVYGDLYVRTEAATLLADKALKALDDAYAPGQALTEAQRGRSAVEIATANVFAGETALDVTSRIFEVTGARSATNAYGLDRFWRNVRTHTLHNPAEYKTRNIGDWVLSGSAPEPGFYQ